MAALFAASAVFLSCSCSGGEPDSGPVIGGETGGGDNTDLPGNIDVTVPESSSDAVAYEDIYDKNPDNSWFNMPVSTRVPKAHWTCVDVIEGETAMTSDFPRILVAFSTIFCVSHLPVS